MNGDGTIDISDGVYVLNWLFAGGPAPVPIEYPPAVASGLPDTGQTTCHDSNGNEIGGCRSNICPGQDGFYQTGCSNEGSFVDNADGTVTDNCTGLMWQKDTGNDHNGLRWCDALAYCENLELAGHDDWRLPNVRELQSIVDYGRNLPAIDPVFVALSSFYRSSTSRGGSPEFAFVVNFDVGFFSNVGKGGGLSHVRAVRSGP